MPIGISLPIQAGSGGYFEQTNDTNSMYRNNIINLLKTIPGERRLNPTFGSRLWNFVFEPYDDLLSTKIEKTLKDDVARWISGVEVTSIEIQTNTTGNVNPKDTYTLYINVNYTILSTNEVDSINLILNNSIPYGQ